MKNPAILLIASALLTACGVGGDKGIINSGSQNDNPADSSPQGRDPTTNAHGPATFNEAKILLRNRVFNTHSLRKTLYCGCSYAADGTVDHLSCGFQPRLNKQGTLSDQDRIIAGRIQFDHIVPASLIGKWRGCWEDGKRKGCEANDPTYNRITSDLVNLRPAIGQVNRDRSNYLYGIIPGEARVYGACDMEIDFNAQIAEPPPDQRGYCSHCPVHERPLWHYFST